MASVNKVTLSSGAISGDTYTTAVSLEGLQVDFAALLKITAIGAGTSLVVKVQTSPDNSTWLDWITFTTATTTTAETVRATTFGMTYARVFFDFTGGTTTCTATVDLYYDKRR
jgi:hypothetical protein